MSKAKSPLQKKELAYERDHRIVPEYPHAFRKNWPRKKAKAQRSIRLKVKTVLKTSQDDVPVGEIRRKTVKKWGKAGGASTLRQMVSSKKQKCQEMVGARKKRQANKAKSKE